MRKTEIATTYILIDSISFEPHFSINYVFMSGIWYRWERNNIEMVSRNHSFFFILILSRRMSHSTLILYFFMIWKQF